VVETTALEIRQKLFSLLKERAFEFRDVVLSSGKASSYYFDGKQVTLDQEGAYLLARIIIDKIKDENIQAVGGPTIGADPIIGALAAVSCLEGLKLNFFIVRKEPKKHGKMRLIEGPELKAGDRVVIVEDVITTGSSVMKAVGTVQELGCEVVKVIVLVDRMEGGERELLEKGISLDAVFTAEDFGLQG